MKGLQKSDCWILTICIIIFTTKIKIHRTVIFPVAFYGCGTWSLTLREQENEDVWEQEAEEESTMKSFIICNLPQILSGCSNRRG
jgi:hypothetical protein